MEVVNFAPEVMFKGALLLLPSCLAPFKVIIPVPFIITPPDPEKVAGHSVETVLADAPALYCRVADAP